MASSCARGDLDWKNFKPWHRLPTTVVESSFLRSFKTCVDVVHGDMLVVLAVLGGWLDFMMSESFSNLNDSVILKDLEFCQK